MKLKTRLGKKYLKTFGIKIVNKFTNKMNKI